MGFFAGETKGLTAAETAAKRAYVKKWKKRKALYGTPYGGTRSACWTPR